MANQNRKAETNHSSHQSEIIPTVITIIPSTFVHSTAAKFKLRFMITLPGVEIGGGGTKGGGGENGGDPGQGRPVTGPQRSKLLAKLQTT